MNETRSGAGVVVLMGPMGAGKTTIALAIEARHDGPIRMLDTDHEIEARAGKSVQEIFVDDGEPAFRAMERELVAEVLGEQAEPAEADFLTVVSLGGGSVMDPASQEVITGLAQCGGVVVFLDVSAPEAARRVGFGVGRPMLGINPRATWIRLMEQRRPTYERLATLTVDTTASEPDACAATILENLPGGPQ